MRLLYSFSLAGARKPPAPELSSSHLLLLALALLHSIGILSAGIHDWQYRCPFESAEGRFGYLQNLPDQRCSVLGRVSYLLILEKTALVVPQEGQARAEAAGRGPPWQREAVVK
jgi:hypothetical protein